MAGMIEQLVQVLEKQTTCYEFLLGLSDEKRETIIKNDIEEIRKLTQLEQMLIENNEVLESDRQALIQDIAFVLNVNVREMTISTLLSRIQHQPGYEALLTISTKMREVIEALKESNDQNKQLIEHSLSYIDFTMNVFRSSLEQEMPSMAGAGGNMGTRSFFDARQ